MEMMSLLDQYEHDVHSEWCNSVEQFCLINLNQPLISRNASSGLVSVNFNPKVTTQWHVPRVNCTTLVSLHHQK